MIVTIGNNKGGVAKTRTTITLAAALARRGAKVLVIDFDGQRNSTQGVLGRFAEGDETVMSWMSGKTAFRDTVYTEVEGWGIDIMPGSVELDDFASYFPDAATYDVLSKAINRDSIRDMYDVVLIDTAPAISETLENALVASDELLLVSTVNGESVEGAKKVIAIATGLSKIFCPNLAIDGVLFTMVQSHYKTGRECLEAAKDYLHETVYLYDTCVRLSTAGTLLSWGNLDICTADPRNNAAKDYEAFADEWVARHKLSFHSVVPKSALGEE